MDFTYNIRGAHVRRLCPLAGLCQLSRVNSRRFPKACWALFVLCLLFFVFYRTDGMTREASQPWADMMSGIIIAGRYWIIPVYLRTARIMKPITPCPDPCSGAPCGRRMLPRIPFRIGPDRTTHCCQRYCHHKLPSPPVVADRKSLPPTGISILIQTTTPIVWSCRHRTRSHGRRLTGFTSGLQR